MMSAEAAEQRVKVLEVQNKELSEKEDVQKLNSIKREQSIKEQEVR